MEQVESLVEYLCLRCGAQGLMNGERGARQNRQSQAAVCPGCGREVLTDRSLPRRALTRTVPASA
ncbi:MAG: hypothetical protein WD535_01175 [Thermaerobacterales bacterium]